MPPQTPLVARVVLLCGPSGVGKSSLVRRLGLPSLALDDYYRDGDDLGDPGDPGRPPLPHRFGVVDWDDPASWDAAGALAGLRALCTTGRADVPVYDIPGNRRTGAVHLDLGGAPLVVAEGIFAAHLVAPCRETGLLADAVCLVLPPWRTFGRRLLRDLAEARKPPPVLVRRGLALLRSEPARVAGWAALGCRPLHPAEAERAIRALAAHSGPTRHSGSPSSAAGPGGDDGDPECQVGEGAAARRRPREDVAMAVAPTSTPAPSAPSAPTRSGLDLAHVDPAVRPQDDLYEHVNGAWLREHVIPADRATDGAFRALHDQAEVDVRAIIEEAAASSPAPGSLEQKIGDLYAAFMDEAAVEAAGTGPVRPLLEAVAAAPDRAALARLLGGAEREGLAALVAAYVDTDARDSTRYLVHLTQAGLGLPDESYYREEQYAPVREAYAAHLARTADLLDLPALLGVQDGAAVSAAVLDLETAVAADHWDVVTNRDAEKTYTLLTAGALRERAPGFDWGAWAAGLGADEAALAEVVVRQPTFVEGVARLWAERPLEQWRAWLALRVGVRAAPYLSSPLVEEQFDFYGRTLSGTQELRERWKRAVSLVEGALGEAVGQLYVQRHFPASSKERMDSLVATLVEAYRRSITDLDWMGEGTRERALAKLAAFTPKVGYPARWKSYDALVVDAGDLLGTVRRSGAVETDRELAKLGRPVDRDEWFMTPQTVNAYYNPGMNEIVFPAAILQPPFFDPGADDAANYGGIGAVIGHEIGHGFDDQGSRYDGAGNLADWWTPEDRAEFERRAAALVAQYSALSPRGLPGHRVNGELTVGENIGDLGGLAIALRAYRIALDGEEPPVVDGLTGLQRVFFAWSAVWRSLVREQEAVRRLAVDPHSPPDLRCNAVVTNLDDFHDAFGVVEGDALFTPPAERVRIW